MDKKTWVVERDASIQIQQLTSEYLEDAIAMMENSFLRYENVCRALGVDKDPKAIAELDELMRATAKDGVTVIAVDKTKNKVIAAAFNKIQVRDAGGETPYFEIFAKTCQQRSSQAVVKFMLDIDNLCDLFDHCQVDCLLEIMFLGTLPEYRGKGIAKRLCEVSIEIAKNLLDGVNVKRSVDGRELGLEPVPKIVSAIFTSFITQRIGRQLDFQIAAERSYELFEFEGKTFASSIRYQLLTKKYLDDACGVLKATLFTSGNLCKAVGVPNDPEAAAELDQLPRRTAKDGVTVIAVEGSKDKVVGVAFNKILQPGGKFYDDLAKSFRNFRALQIIDLLHNENICNLFEHCQVDCLMEIMLLGTLPEYRKRGIAKKMCEISVEVAQKLLDGVNVKQSIDGEELPLEPVPKMVTATFGSFISQRIGRQLGSIHYQLLTAKYLDAACEVIKSTLFAPGNPFNPETLAELDQLPRTAAEDGVSIIAIDKNKDKVVGVAFNKLFTPGHTFYEDFKKSFNNPRSLRVVDFIVACESMCNLFERCQADCLMEIFLLGTLPEYRKQGIAKKLCKMSITVAQKLLDGVNVKRSLEGEELPLEPTPEAVTAIFNSFSRGIGRKLGFEIAAE
ncbi:uncharacterized protein BDFB_005282, partial [Asbolus verrucosus]